MNQIDACPATASTDVTRAPGVDAPASVALSASLAHSVASRSSNVPACGAGVLEGREGRGRGCRVGCGLAPAATLHAACHPRAAPAAAAHRAQPPALLPPPLPTHRVPCRRRRRRAAGGALLLLLRPQRRRLLLRQLLRGRGRGRGRGRRRGRGRGRAVASRQRRRSGSGRAPRAGPPPTLPLLRGVGRPAGRPAARPPARPPLHLGRERRVDGGRAGLGAAGGPVAVRQVGLGGGGNRGWR
jgi:hypothetical protein